MSSDARLFICRFLHVDQTVCSVQPVKNSRRQNAVETQNAYHMASGCGVGIRLMNTAERFPGVQRRLY